MIPNLASFNVELEKLDYVKEILPEIAVKYYFNFHK